MADRSARSPIFFGSSSFLPLIVNQAKVVDYLGKRPDHRCACERIDVCQ